MLALMAIFATSGAFSQEWTKAQSEVWQVVEKAWKDYQTGNWESVAASMHPNYQGWDDHTFLPYSKEKALQQVKDYFTTAKLQSFDIEPARITVIKDAAVVNYYYYYTLVTVLADKKETLERKGMYVEFYVKDGGKWLLLGDMTTISK